VPLAVTAPEPLMLVLSAAVASFDIVTLPDPETARPVRSFTVREYLIGWVGMILALLLDRSTSVSPDTSLVSFGSRLSSAETVSDSVPFCSIVNSPDPLSSTLLKPLT
jgi:hypothetical protein